MIDLIDRRLEDWIRSVLENVEVSLAAPDASESGRAVGLYLLELIHAPAARTAQRPPDQMMLRYLVTTRDERPEEAHRLLGELAFAALENAELEVETEPVSESLWAAFGVAPRPSLVLRVPLRRERPEAAAQRVRLPLVVKHAALTSVGGQVVGPGDVPVAGARVELPSARLSARTDADGRFFFSSVPTEPRPRLWRVRAKGREFSVTTELAGEDGRPLVIRLQGLEE